MKRQTRTLLVMAAVALLAGGVIYYTDHRAQAAERAATIQTARKLDVATRALALRFAQHQRATNLKGCKRGNVLRRGLNDTTRTQEQFLHTALIARLHAVKSDRAFLAAGHPPPNEVIKATTDLKLNAQAAKVYATLLAHYHIVPIVDCKRAYPPITTTETGG